MFHISQFWKKCFFYSQHKGSFTLVYFEKKPFFTARQYIHPFLFKYSGLTVKKHIEFFIILEKTKKCSGFNKKFFFTFLALPNKNCKMNFLKIFWCGTAFCWYINLDKELYVLVLWNNMCISKNGYNKLDFMYSDK